MRRMAVRRRVRVRCGSVLRRLRGAVRRQLPAHPQRRRMVQRLVLLLLRRLLTWQGAGGATRQCGVQRRQVQLAC